MIKRKEKTCKRCGNLRALFGKGLCRYCYGFCLSKSASKPVSGAKIKVNRPKGSAELNRWFQERRLEMTGVCANCGRPSCRDDDQYYKFSIAHILPKAYVKSVKTHPDNWIELCFWGENSCHTQLDNNLLDLTELNCWDTVVCRFQRVYPDIVLTERRRIPQVLRNYIEVDI